MIDRPTKPMRGPAVNLDMPDPRFRQVEIVREIQLHMIKPTPEALGFHYMLLGMVRGTQDGVRDLIMQGTFELVDFIAHTKTRASFLRVPFGHSVDNDYRATADVAQAFAYRLFEDGGRIRYERHTA